MKLGKNEKTGLPCKAGVGRDETYTFKNDQAVKTSRKKYW